MTSWLDVVHAFARARSVPAAIVDALGAFVGPEPRGGPPPPHEMPWHESFEALERACMSIDPGVIAADLREEVDVGQAALFHRRFVAVDAAIAELADDTARVLRVGLRHRLAGILQAPRPRALRVRALADFYFSLAGRHRIARVSTGGPTVAALAGALRWEQLAPGIRYAKLEALAQGGPVHANLLRLSPEHARLQVVDCREHVGRGTDFPALVRAAGAIAAISGGFFLYSEPDIALPSQQHDPVGLLMDEGVVHNLPTMRRGTLAIAEDESFRIGAIGMLDVEIEDCEGRRRPTWVVNRAHARVGPAEDSAAIVGLSVIDTGASLAVPLNGCVIPRGGLKIGDRVRVVAVSDAEGPVRSAIAGGPLLLHEGRPVLDLRAEDFWGSAPPVTFSQDETGDRNLLPRLAAGLTRGGELVLAAIDGRNFERALGMTLGEVGELLAVLGCHTATNLDGGSSKRMVVRGAIRDLPTTEITDGVAVEAPPVRPVYTAVLVHPR